MGSAKNATENKFNNLSMGTDKLGSQQKKYMNM